MAMTGKRIGDILEVWCSRCRLNLDASVAALVSGEVVKVTCRTCGNEVKYQPPQDMRERKQKALERLMRAREKKRAGLPVSAMTGPSALRKLWDELTDKVDARDARVYEAARTYEPEDALLHKQFGMGIVHEVQGDGLLRVLFRDGFRELPSGQEPPEDDD